MYSHHHPFIFKNVALTRFSAFPVLLFGLFGLLFTTACNKDPEADREKFLGKYSVQETCNPNLSFEMIVYESNTGENDILITNFGNFGHNVTATVSGNTLTIHMQNFTINTGTPIVITLSGSGNTADNTMTVVYSWSSSSSGGEITCIMTCTKQ